VAVTGHEQFSLRGYCAEKEGRYEKILGNTTVPCPLGTNIGAIRSLGTHEVKRRPRSHNADAEQLAAPDSGYAAFQCARLARRKWMGASGSRSFLALGEEGKHIRRARLFGATIYSGA